MNKNYTKYWINFLKKNRQPLSCEVSRLIMIAEHYFKENQEYYNKDDANYCDTLSYFVAYAKRPYGNKNIPASIAFNLGWGYEENDFMTEEAQEEAWRIHNKVIEKLISNNR